jgi:hypothetical protein
VTCHRWKNQSWIVILQEFDLDFVSVKSKKSLVFAELISELSVESGDISPEESPINGDIFLIASFGPLVWRYTCVSSDFEVPLLLLLMMSVDEYDTKHETISSSMTLCIIEV